MTTNIVEDFYNKYNELLERLRADGEASLEVWAHDYFKRIFLIVISNYFENELKEIILRFTAARSGSPLITSFLERKAIERQYYTYFSWKETNANSFFSLFGDTFSKQAEADVKKDNNLEEGIKAFLKIGNTRNKLIHGKLLELKIEDTAKDSYDLYQKALVFIKYISDRFEYSTG